MNADDETCSERLAGLCLKGGWFYDKFVVDEGRMDTLLFRELTYTGVATQLINFILDICEQTSDIPRFQER